MEPLPAQSPAWRRSSPLTDANARSERALCVIPMSLRSAVRFRRKSPIRIRVTEMPYVPEATEIVADLKVVRTNLRRFVQRQHSPGSLTA